MPRSLDQILTERGIENERLLVPGRLFASKISDDDYLEICKTFERITEEDFQKSVQESTEKKRSVSETFLKDRLLTFVASDETVDSYGDILRVDGADLSRFKSGSAAFITSHDMRNVSGSSGVIVKAWKVKNAEGSPEGKAILVLVYFPTAEEDPDADYIFKKFRAGTLRAVSVGLQVKEYFDPEDDNERKRLGLGKYGIEVKKWLPYELSAVTVGANPNALIRKGIGEKEMESMVRKIVSETISQTATELKKESANSLEKAMAETPIKIKL